MRFTVLALSAALVGACAVEDDPTASTRGSIETEDASGSQEGLEFQPAESTCLPSAPMEAHGLCLCDSFTYVGELEVRRSAESLPASVGVNGESTIVAKAIVEGSWHAHDGFRANAWATIEGSLLTTGNYFGVGSETINGDLSVGQDVLSVGDLTVGGALAVAGRMMVAGELSHGSLGAYQAPSAPPCACSGDGFFDVAKAVEDAKESNDNSVVNLAPDGQLRVGKTEFALPTGRYYIGDWTSVGDTRIRIEGKVALYVGGSMMSIGHENIELADGATLDLYVAGSVFNVGQVVIGSPSRAGDFRLLIGGHDDVALSLGQLSVGKQRFYGHIYAPTAALAYAGDTEIHGSLFADRLIGVGKLKIFHASASTPPEEVCEGFEGEIK